ncbi:MAG: MarR family transcriptional regulator [Thermoplasmata archaeon]|nr:MAG: MarR family transcriptional regulator [Thermoplasmata archaeon]
MKQQKSIGRYISYIHRNFHIQMHHELKQYHLGSGQFHLLMILYKKDGVNQETIAEKLKIDKATIARSVKKLEENEYIIRMKDKQDRRNYNIYLTDKAKHLHPKIKQILKKWTKQLLLDFSENEIIQLYSFLERMEQNTTTQ